MRLFRDKIIKKPKHHVFEVGKLVCVPSRDLLVMCWIGIKSTGVILWSNNIYINISLSLTYVLNPQGPRPFAKRKNLGGGGGYYNPKIISAHSGSKWLIFSGTKYFVKILIFCKKAWSFLLQLPEFQGAPKNRPFSALCFSTLCQLFFFLTNFNFRSLSL